MPSPNGDDISKVYTIFLMVFIIGVGMG